MIKMVNFMLHLFYHPEKKKNVIMLFSQTT